jgi:hypothetical protein
MLVLLRGRTPSAARHSPCHPERSPALFLSRRTLAGAGGSEACLPQAGICFSRGTSAHTTTHSGIPRTYLYGARERTRTSTPLRELAPEASASANSATRALLVCGKTKLRGSSILTRAPWFVNAAHHHRELLTRLHDRTTLNRWARGEQETKTWLPPAR